MSRRPRVIALAATGLLALADLGWVCGALCPQIAEALTARAAPVARSRERTSRPATPPSLPQAGATAAVRSPPATEPLTDVPRPAPAAPSPASVEPSSPPDRARPPALDPVVFPTAGAQIHPSAVRRFWPAAIYMREHPRARLLLRGHADGRGNDEDNVELSRARAAAVARVLAQLGVPAERISTQALGSAEPVDLTNTPEAWRRNRRVELVWIQ